MIAKNINIKRQEKMGWIIAAYLWDLNHFFLPQQKSFLFSQALLGLHKSLCDFLITLILYESLKVVLHNHNHVLLIFNLKIQLRCPQLRYFDIKMGVEEAAIQNRGMFFCLILAYSKRSHGIMAVLSNKMITWCSFCNC